MPKEVKEKSPKIFSRARQKITEFRQWDRESTFKLLEEDPRKFFFLASLIMAPLVVGTGQIIQWLSPK